MEETSLKDSPRREAGIGLWKSWRAILLFFRCFLGSVFLYAGVEKLRDIALFTTDVQGYQIFPEALVRPVATYLPFLEIIVGAALLTRVAYPGALLLSGSMFAVFLAALGSALWRDLDIDCGCFGHGDSGRSLGWAITTDAVLCCIWLCLGWQLLKNRESVASMKTPTEVRREIQASLKPMEE